MFRSAITKPLFAAARPALVRTTARPAVAARQYHEKVISHYEKPRNVCVSPFLRILDLGACETCYLITFPPLF